MAYKMTKADEIADIESRIGNIEMMGLNDRHYQDADQLEKLRERLEELQEPSASQKIFDTAATGVASISAAAVDRVLSFGKKGVDSVKGLVGADEASQRFNERLRAIRDNPGGATNRNHDGIDHG